MIQKQWIVLGALVVSMTKMSAAEGALKAEDSLLDVAIPSMIATHVGSEFKAPLPVNTSSFALKKRILERLSQLSQRAHKRKKKDSHKEVVHAGDNDTVTKTITDYVTEQNANLTIFVFLGEADRKSSGADMLEHRHDETVEQFLAKIQDAN
jgi:hypothetical protein